MPRFGPYVFNYNPPITLWFDSDTHTYLREYGPELVPQRGVTTILRIIDRSEYLIPWSAKVVVTKAATIMPTWEDGLDVYTKCIPLAEFLDLLDQAKKAPREILEDAGNVGEEAHRALEDSIKYAISTNGGQVEKLVHIPKDPRAVSCCAAALDWMHQHAVRFKSTERKIYSREFEYAGTMDGLALVNSCENHACCPNPFTDRLSVIDWKSSNQLNTSYLLQIAAYWRAYREETQESVTDGFILRLGKESGEFEPWHVGQIELAADFTAFESCLHLTNDYEVVKVRMAESKKARTVRKRTAAREAKEAERFAKTAAKQAKAVKKNTFECIDELGHQEQ